jgi:hypothetical protein
MEAGDEIVEVFPTACTVGRVQDKFLRNPPRKISAADRNSLKQMAGPTRLELATSCVTGRRSNRLNYGPAGKILDWWAVRDLNTRPSGCKPDALTAELTAPYVKILQVTRKKS